MVSVEEASMVQFQGEGSVALRADLKESRRRICLGLHRYSGFSTLYTANPPKGGLG
jgi:hypothetical protein